MLMNPSVNMNGTSRESLIQTRRDAMDALLTAMRALQETAPHGRDYVGRSFAFETDRDIYRTRFAALDKMRNELQDEALNLLESGPRGGKV